MKNKGVTIAALIIAIIGLSIGFAAFSNTLTIRSSASVNPSSENFVVKFSKVSDADQTGDTYPITPIIAQNSTATGSNGTIDSSNPLLLTGLSASFTSPGQSVSYKLYVRNTGHYRAYLTNLNFKNVAGTSSTKSYSGDATESLMQAALADINVSVMLGGSDGVGGTTYTTSNDNISNTYLDPGDYIETYVTISYANNGHYVDGNMRVTFGDIMLQYRSVDTPLAIPDSVVVVPDYTSEFLSLEQGVLSRYLGNSTEPVIPDDLSLPVTTLTYTYDEDICVAGAQSIGAANNAEQALNLCQTSLKPAFLDNEELVSLTAEELSEAIDMEIDALPLFAKENKSVSNESYPITTIAGNSFTSLRDDITAITIGEGITTISNFTFDEFSSLATVTIGSGIRNIGNDALRRIASNPTITIGTTRSNVQLGMNAFDNGVTIQFSDGPYTYGS